jgi:uncharacterized protein (DUF488 family)
MILVPWCRNKNQMTEFISGVYSYIDSQNGWKYLLSNHVDVRDGRNRKIFRTIKAQPIREKIRRAISFISKKVMSINYKTNIVLFFRNKTMKNSNIPFTEGNYGV